MSVYGHSVKLGNAGIFLWSDSYVCIVLLRVVTLCLSFVEGLFHWTWPKNDMLSTVISRTLIVCMFSVFPIICSKWYYLACFKINDTHKYFIYTKSYCLKKIVTYDRSVVFSGYSGFLNQSNWPPRYYWNIVESGVKHHIITLILKTIM